MFTSLFALFVTFSSAALPFYRGPLSLFPSGQASRNQLEDKLIRSEYEAQYVAQWNKREYHLKGENFLREIQVARQVQTRTGVEILAEKKSTAKVVEALPAHSSLEILDCDSYWALVLHPSHKTQGYVPLHLLHAKNEDLGVIVNIVDTFLRPAPEGHGLITTVPRMSRLIPISYKGSWVQVRYGDFKGYVDLNHFVSRADFARMVFHRKKKWTLVSHRENNFLISERQEKLAMEDIQGFVTTTNRGIVISGEDEKLPPLQARVDILKTEAHIWGISQLDGHGEVWWQKSDLLETAETKSEEGLSSEELMKRKIYSLSFENKKSLRGLVSADGVYRTEDGSHWKKIAQFADQNLPVSIHPEGNWYVGSYKSTDGGKTFEPFIRWDVVAQSIEASIHRAPRILRLTRIEALPHSQIQIQVDTGVQRLEFRAALSDSTKWKLVR